MSRVRRRVRFYHQERRNSSSEMAMEKIKRNGEARMRAIPAWDLPEKRVVILNHSLSGMQNTEPLLILRCHLVGRASAVCSRNHWGSIAPPGT